MYCTIQLLFLLPKFLTQSHSEYSRFSVPRSCDKFTTSETRLRLTLYDKAHISRSPESARSQGVEMRTIMSMIETLDFGWLAGWLTNAVISEYCEPDNQLFISKPGYGKSLLFPLRSGFLSPSSLSLPTPSSLLPLPALIALSCIPSRSLQKKYFK